MSVVLAEELMIAKKADYVSPRGNEREWRTDRWEDGKEKYKLKEESEMEYQLGRMIVLMKEYTAVNVETD